MHRVVQSNNWSLDMFMIGAVTISLALYTVDAICESELADAETAAACRYPPASSLITAQHVRTMEDRGFVVLHNALSPPQLEAARLDVQKLRYSSSAHGNEDSVRGDSICWVRETDGTESNAATASPQKDQPHGDGLYHAIKLVRSIAYCLEHHGYTRSHAHRVPQQCQLSCYEGDSRQRYRRHLDTCLDTVYDMGLFNWWRSSDYRYRKVTIILYLNDSEWGKSKRDGGELRCYHERSVSAGDDDDYTYTDVQPAGGTMVVFDSCTVAHEVLPSSRDRFALTCWVNGCTGRLVTLP